MEVSFNPLTPDIKFNNIYQCTKKINSGSFGTVYAGINLLTKEEVAIKIEKITNEEMRSVFREAQFLKRLESIKGIPKVYWAGSHEKYDVMVISLLGKDLSQIFIENYNFNSRSINNNFGRSS